MALPTISYRYAFGIKTDVKENIGFLDEQTVIYPAGSNLIIYNAENKSQRFITMTEHCESITSLCISNTRRYCAVAERSTVEKPQVVIYDLHTLRRKKVLVPSSEIESKEYVALAFSSDAKFIITQTGAPDWMMYFWLWEKGKLMASFRTTQDKPTSNLPPPTGFKDRDAGGTINQVSFNPLDSNQICTIGNGVFRLYRYQDGGCKQLSFSKFEPRNFTSHAWICDDRLVVGSEDGRLLIFESTGELKIEIVYSNGTTNAPKQIYGIVAYLKGFIVAGEGGFMSVYEKEDPGLAGQVSAAAIAKELFRKTREYSLPFDNVRVLTLAISPSEDNIICTLENSQIYTLMVTSSEMKGDEAKFNLLAQPFHHGPIIGMDICIRKPLIVTCSSDKSIRVWNYLENTSELVKYFPEEAFSVAIHPNGLYILVGFGDKLKLMNLLIDDIRPFREFTIRGCRECQFSTGGQYFAAAHGNAIQLYNTWNFENIGNLKGHSGKVRTIAFTSDDSRIITASIDGTIFEWSLRDVYGFNGIGIKKESESTVKNCSYTSVVTSPDGRSAYAVGSDKIIKEIMEGQLLKQVEVDIPLTQIAISHGGKVLFAGTSTGRIRVMRLPLQNNVENEYLDYHGHHMPITRLHISSDDQYLFSVSEDSCLYIYKIIDKEGRTMKRDREVIYADEILVTKSDLEEKNSVMLDLKTRVEELKMENEYQLRLKDMNFSEKLKDVSEKFMQEIEALKITSTVLKTDKEKEDIRHNEEMAEEADHHARELLELEAIHKAKLTSESEKYKELQARTLDMQRQWERQMKEMQQTKDAALKEMNNHFQEQEREKQAEIDQIQEEIKKMVSDFHNSSAETEFDADCEIRDLMYKFEKRMKEEHELGLRLKADNNAMKKTFNELQQRIKEGEENIKKSVLNEKKLQGIIKSLEKDIAGLKKEIQERDETIQDKEKRIYDLKKKNQELEKFKFVLDYKIKELKRQVEPREQDIQEMTAQIKEMDVELDLYHKSNADLEFSIADLKLKLKASDREVEKEKNKVNALTNFLRRFKIELNECAQQSSDPKKLKGQVKALYQKYCKENINEDEEEVDIQQEYARQREYLERTAASLKKKVVKDQSLHRIDNVRIMDENVALLKEINLLRKDLLGGRHKKLADKAVIAAAAESHGRPNMSQRNGSAPGPTITLPSVEHH